MSTPEGETVFGHLQRCFILGQTTLPLTASASLQHMLSVQACMKLTNKSRTCFHTLLLMSFISLLLDVSSLYAACYYMLHNVLISAGHLIERIRLYFIWSECKSRILHKHTQHSYCMLLLGTFLLLCYY